MVLCYNIAGGNWLTAGTWLDGRIPQAADTVELRPAGDVTLNGEIAAIGQTNIKSGGKLIPAFQMSSSNFGNIVVESGGQIYVSRSVSSTLRVNGTIDCQGATPKAVDYGTESDPIPLNVAAVLVFVCSQASQTGRGFVVTAESSVSGRGADRTLWQTTLAEAATVGDTHIHIADDLALRAGTLNDALYGKVDIIVIGHNTTHTANGTRSDEIDVYIVAGYDPVTKIVTLGSIGAGGTYWIRGGSSPNYNNIDANRAIGTSVYLISSNVLFRGSGSSATPANLFSRIRGIFLRNVLIFYADRALYEMLQTGTDPTLDNVMILGVTTGVYVDRKISVATPLIKIVGAQYGFAYVRGGIVSGLVIGAATAFYTVTNLKFIGDALSNNYVASTCAGLILQAGCVLDNLAISIYSCIILKDLLTVDGHNNLFGQGSIFSAKNINFGTFFIGFNAAVSGRLDNCLFSLEDIYYEYDNKDASPRWGYVESFSHNQVPGSYKAWSRGGKVSKQVSHVPPGAEYAYEMIGATTLADYPGFYQQRYTMQPYETIHFKAEILLVSSFTNPPTLQILDRFRDPLEDTNETPLISVQVPNILDVWQSIDAMYYNNSPYPKQIILRLKNTEFDHYVYFLNRLTSNKKTQNVLTDQEGGR